MKVATNSSRVKPLVTSKFTLRFIWDYSGRTVRQMGEVICKEQGKFRPPSFKTLPMSLRQTWRLEHRTCVRCRSFHWELYHNRDTRKELSWRPI
jgi:hypothetical protein